MLQLSFVDLAVLLIFNSNSQIANEIIINYFMRLQALKQFLMADIEAHQARDATLGSLTAKPSGTIIHPTFQ